MAKEKSSHRPPGVSVAWETVDGYARFLVQKFGSRINAHMWNSTKSECAESGIPWITSTTLKACLTHFVSCDAVPDDVHARAQSLIKQLSRPGLMEPWLIKTKNKYCEYCREAAASAVSDAVVADVDVDDAVEDDVAEGDESL
jgi:hypothetical protein